MNELDFAFINGLVITVNPNFDVVSAFGVKDGKFAAVGSAQDVLSMAGEGTQVIDLAGKTVLPGLIDSHLHMNMSARGLSILDLRGLTKSEVLSAVRQKAKDTPRGEWIYARGWNNDAWQDTSFPCKEELDEVSPYNPACLIRSCAHAAWVNSKAFEELNIDENVKDPQGGEFVKDSAGKLTGIVKDMAIEPFKAFMPALDAQALQSAMLKAQDMLLSYGLTSVCDAGASPSDVDAFRDLYAQDKLKIRIYAALYISYNSFAELLAKTKEAVKGGVRIGECGSRLTVRAYKAILDGALGSSSAYLLNPYSDAPGRGTAYYTEGELYELLRVPYSCGFQLMTHAIGDGAVRRCLNVYQRLKEEFPRIKDSRMRAEHVQVIDMCDIDRFFSLGVIPSVQTVFMRTDKDMAPRRLGPRAQNSYLWRTLIDKGNILPNGTDCPIHPANPFLAMYCAVTRKDERGRPKGGWRAGEAMTRVEALKSYTIWGAYACFQEKVKGSIEPAKFADFVVIDRDYLNVQESEIKDIQVLAAYIGGEQVYIRT